MNITQFYIAIAVGLAISLLVEETLGIICGGALAAGYLAMVCDDPITMVLVFAISLLTYLIVEFVLPRFVILFGKRRLVACLLVGLVLKLGLDLLVPIMPFASLTYRGVGVIVPGLIANACCKQGLRFTIPAVLAATYATFGVVQLILQLM